MPTPWSSSSSLVSDRIPPPSKQQQQQPQNKGRGKTKPATPEPRKSKAIRTLEAHLDGIRGPNGRTKDPKGGCFCQARNHVLSSYVPMCHYCGLVLCMLNPPHYACPHCSSPLLDDRQRVALTERLEGELAAQFAREEAERRRAIEEARAAEGAFPTLPGSQAKRMGTPPPALTTRTVLSLNSETKRVMVSSYGTKTSRPASREEDTEEEVRVPGPPGEVNYVKEPPDPGRPWKNVRAGDVRYVPQPGQMTGDTSREGGKTKGDE